MKRLFVIVMLCLSTKSGAMTILESESNFFYTVLEMNDTIALLEKWQPSDSQISKREKEIWKDVINEQKNKANKYIRKNITGNIKKSIMEGFVYKAIGFALEDKKLNNETLKKVKHIFDFSNFIINREVISLEKKRNFLIEKLILCITHSSRHTNKKEDLNLSICEKLRGRCFESMIDTNLIGSLNSDKKHFTKDEECILKNLCRQNQIDELICMKVLDKSDAKLIVEEKELYVKRGVSASGKYMKIKKFN